MVVRTLPFLKVLELEGGDKRIKGFHYREILAIKSPCMQGLKHARGLLMITMDGDLQHPPEFIPHLITKSKEALTL